MRQGLFAFRCAEPTHQHSTDAKTVSQPITIHEGRWAYCAAGAADGHDWHEIEPAALSEVRRPAHTNHAPLDADRSGVRY